MGVHRSTGLLLLAACVGCYSGLSNADTASDSDAGATETEGASGGSDDGGNGDGPAAACDQGDPIERATLRRLTRFEYNNTVRDRLGDTTLPANAFPSENLANGFGNDANAQAVSSLLAEQYNAVAEDVAARATETPAKLGLLSPCASTITDTSAVTEVDACAQTLITSFVERAYRRPLATGEADELVEIAAVLREDVDFATSIAGIIEAVLQSPDFLYRFEYGFTDDNGHRRPTGYEMATRLSYQLWGTMPDETLLAAAEAGELVDAASVASHAERMLNDERSHAVVRFFFDNFLPISALSQLERDPTRYPQYDSAVGAAMREETQRFLEYEIFEGPGTWDAALTAPYTFVNEDLAAFYGIEGVTGESFVKVDLDTTQRLGFLTQAGVVAGTIHSNETNPVTRGAFLTRTMLCNEIPLPGPNIPEEDVRPPNPDSAPTARERFNEHSVNPICAGCHTLMDPLGLPFENYDPVGLWRDTENGVTIDASGTVAGVEIDGPVELVQAIAGSERTYGCFALQWSEFAYGRTHAKQDGCVTDDLAERFTDSGYDVKGLLLELTQTDDFLFLPTEDQ
jgi:hypothetical protein